MANIYKNAKVDLSTTDNTTVYTAPSDSRAISGLLLTIWKSRCECDMNCCYIWRCHRKPPPENVSEIEEEGEEKQKDVKPTSPEVPEIPLVPPPPPLEDKMKTRAEIP